MITNNTNDALENLLLGDSNGIKLKIQIILKQYSQLMR